MILIDKRAGSSTLAGHIQPAELVHRPLGIYDADFSFCGYGPEGDPVLCGGEYKQIEDALKSFSDGRFSGEQLPKLLSFDRAFLLIEGAYRPGADGVLEIRQWDRERKRMGWGAAQFGGHAWTYRQFDSWIATLQEKVEYDFGVPMSVWRTWTVEESAAWVVNRYLWWTARPYAEHRSHLKWMSPDARLQTASRKRRSANILAPMRTVDLPLVRRWANDCPTIGPDKSLVVAQHFKTPIALALGSVKDWMEIKGVGRIGATRIVKAIEGEE